MSLNGIYRYIFAASAAVCAAMLLVSCLSGSPYIPRELVGKWDHGGSIYSVSRDGRISVWDGSASIREVGNGKLAIEINGRETLYEYYIDSDGVLHLGGTAYYPVP